MNNSVIIFSQYPFPGGSAASLRIFNLAEGLLANNVNVHVISPYYMPSRRQLPITDHRSTLNTYYVFPTVTLPRVYNDVMYKSRVSSFAYNIVNEIIRTEKVLLIYLYDGTSYLYFNQISKLAGKHYIPLTFDITEWRDNNYPVFAKGVTIRNRINSILLYPDYLWGKRFILPRANFFISITTLLRDYLSGYHRDVMVIPGFEKFDATRVHQDAAKGKVIFLYVGSLIDRDDPPSIELILNVLSQNRNEVEFRFVGRYNSNPSGKKLMAHWIHTFGKMVVSLGEVDEDKIENKLLESDVFVLTRKDTYEERCAFPTRLAEYLALKKPVILSPVGDIPLYLDNGIDACHLVVEKDKKLSAKSLLEIGKLVTDKSFRDFIGTNGYIKGEQYFDHVRNAREILDRVDQPVLQKEHA